EYFACISPGSRSTLSEAIVKHLHSSERQRDVLASQGVGEHVLLETLSRLYTLGFTLNWSAMYTGAEKCISLPTYCWKRERFWLDDMDVDVISTLPEMQ